MGVHRDYRSQGLGTWILDFVVGLARELSEQVGVRYVTLDALPRERLVQWYADYGFVRNHGEEFLQKTVRWLYRKVSRDKELPHVSMRFDILLQSEL